MTYHMHTTPEARERYEARKQRDALRALMIARREDARSFALYCTGASIVVFVACLQLFS